MNERSQKAKERLLKANQKIIDDLEESIKLSVFQDTVSDEQLKKIKKETGGYNYFRFETGGFTRNKDKSELSQTVMVAFYSENRDDLDEVSLDIIDTIDGKLHVFKTSRKAFIQKGKEDSYIDEIQFFFERRLPYVC